jgi:very-short-patch-repair endonuclease
MNPLRNKEYYDREFVKKQRSPQDIANEWNTYTNCIRRELKKMGYSLRSRSEAQVVALNTGRHKHPTKGHRRDEDTKSRISEAVAKNWKNMSTTERNRRETLGRKQWENMSELEKSEFQRLSMDAVRTASKEGSQLEKYLCNELRNHGFEVSFHGEHILPGTKLQTDLYLPGLLTVIEIDGPSHFFPIWGEDKLEKTEEADKLKNKILLTYGFIIIRVKHLAKTTSQFHKRKLLHMILAQLDNIKNSFPALPDRLIEIELS